MTRVNHAHHCRSGKFMSSGILASSSPLRAMPGSRMKTIVIMPSHPQKPHSTLADYATGLDERIRSLARTHELLSDSRWGGVSLADILRRELAPYATDNAEIGGPGVTLKAEAAQAIGMVLHELATNAAKYGAFSKPGGRLLLRWRWLRSGSRGPLAIEWQEVGGPPIVKPSQFGYGTDTIRELIPFELGGTSTSRLLTASNQSVAVLVRAQVAGSVASCAPNMTGALMSPNDTGNPWLSPNHTKLAMRRSTLNRAVVLDHISHHGRTLRCQGLHDFSRARRYSGSMETVRQQSSQGLLRISGYSQYRNSRFPCGRDAVLDAAGHGKTCACAVFSRPGSDWGVAGLKQRRSAC